MTIYRYGSIVPLIGGNTIAARNVLGYDPEALLTYKAFADNEKNLRAYMPQVPYEVLDDGGDQAALAGADFITALCPCAGLSTLGTGDATMRENANSWMFASAKHVLGTLKPKVFWGENAPAMYESKLGESVRERLKQIADDNGYTMSFYFTSTHLHGVPQRRHRTFYFFWREQGRVPVMPYYHKQAPTWGEYMAQIPAGATQHDDDKERAYKQLRSTRFAKFAHARFGEGFPDVIRERMREQGKTMVTVQDFVLKDPKAPERPKEMRDWYSEPAQAAADPRAAAYFDRIHHKMFVEDKGIWDDSPSIFLPEVNFNALIGRTTDAAHPYEHRSLTIRECLHMMALPNDFNLVTKTINHICQNVPVCTASDMTRGVVDYLEGRLPFTDGDVVWQNNFKHTVDKINGESKLISF
jgi:site-specific DNA-cytosine methylase